MRRPLAVCCGCVIGIGLLGIARAEDSGIVRDPSSAGSLPSRIWIRAEADEGVPGFVPAMTETPPGKSEFSDESSGFVQAVSYAGDVGEVGPADFGETLTSFAPTEASPSDTDVSPDAVATDDANGAASAAAPRPTPFSTQALFSADGLCSPAAPFSPGLLTFNNACPCFFYAQFDALFIQREPRFTRQPIVVDPNTHATLLSTSNLNFNFNPGLRTTIGMRILERRLIEFTYFGLYGGTASAAAAKPDPGSFLTFPNNLAGNVFVGMDRAQVNYSSSLQSFAVNLPCCCGCCSCGCCDQCGGGMASCRSFIWYGGFRYLNLGERLNIAAQKTVSGQVEQGAYNIRTNNNLFGGQFGAMLRRTWGRFGVEAMGNSGVYGNAAQEKQSVTDFPNFALRPLVSASRGGAAFVGETNLSGLYRITNIWNLRAGYSAIWLGGLALAPDQLNFNFAAAQGGNQLYNGRGMFLHGVNVGLEAWW